jgi:amino acid transporter
MIKKYIGDYFIIVVFLSSIGFFMFKLIRKSSFDLQGDSPPISKIIMLVVLIFALYFLMRYLYSTFGLMKWHVILILVFIGVLLYRLFNVNKVIFKYKDGK